MGGLFSKPKKQSRITDTDRSILTLKLQKDQLLLVRNRLTIQYDQADISVRKLLFDDKKSLALVALKHKKHQLELLCRAEEYLLQVNQIISNVEMASVQNDVIRALEAGNSALTSIQSEIAVDYVQSLLESNAELASDVEEVNSLLANVKLEDEALFEEYMLMEAEVALQKVASIPSVPPLSTRRELVQAHPRELSEDPLEAS